MSLSENPDNPKKQFETALSRLRDAIWPKQAEGITDQQKLTEQTGNRTGIPAPEVPGGQLVDAKEEMDKTKAKEGAEGKENKPEKVPNKMVDILAPKVGPDGKEIRKPRKLDYGLTEGDPVMFHTLQRGNTLKKFEGAGRLLETNLKAQQEFPFEVQVIINNVPGPVETVKIKCFSVRVEVGGQEVEGWMIIPGDGTIDALKRQAMEGGSKTPEGPPTWDKQEFHLHFYDKRDAQQIDTLRPVEERNTYEGDRITYIYNVKEDKPCKLPCIDICPTYQAPCRPTLRYSYYNVRYSNYWWMNYSNSWRANWSSGWGFRHGFSR